MTHRFPLLILSLAACGAVHDSARGESRWHNDLPTAQRIAERDHKPLFVVFRCER